MNEIDILLQDHQRYHSEFQIDNFIVGQEVDDFARYKQALREIDSRKRRLANVEQKNEIALLEFQSLKRRRFFCFTRLQKTRHKFQVQNARHAKKDYLIEIDEIKRELERFVKLALELKKQFGNLTPEKRAELEASSWFKKGRQMAAIDMYINHGQISQKSMEFILMLPAQHRSKILIELKNDGPLCYLEN